MLIFLCISRVHQLLHTAFLNDHEIWCQWFSYEASDLNAWVLFLHWKVFISFVLLARKPKGRRWGWFSILNFFLFFFYISLRFVFPFTALSIGACYVFFMREWNRCRVGFCRRHRRATSAPDKETPHCNAVTNLLLRNACGALRGGFCVYF